MESTHSDLMKALKSVITCLFEVLTPGKLYEFYFLRRMDIVQSTAVIHWSDGMWVYARLLLCVCWSVIRHWRTEPQICPEGIAIGVWVQVWMFAAPRLPVYKQVTMTSWDPNGKDYPHIST